jgi:deazaflavin-dependent oxidoreductase (nitroreductase family)
MTFTTGNGTRGARQPGGKLMLWVNRLMAKRIRKTGRATGFNALVLTTVGRKSGIPRQTPVGYFPDGDNWLIVASAAGAARNPDWYYNLASHPDNVQIEPGSGRKIRVTAQELHGAERQRAWQGIVAASPRFGQYQEKTDREIPVIRLTPRAS